VYTAHFGFTEKPFNVTPDPRFFYANRVYQEAYAALLYGVLERKGFIVLTGEVGTGKTTLLRRLMDNLDPSVRVIFFYNTTLDFDELVQFICAELELPVAGLGRVERLQALNHFLIQEARKGSTVVLILDEAQHLSAEVLESLRLLSNLETATEKLLQILLVGQPELDATLADPALRQVTQRVAVRYRLAGLSDAEVGTFIAHRLRVAGRPRQDVFTADAVRRVALYARGIPRLVNVLCDGALLIAYGTGARTVTGPMVDEVAADLGLAPRAPARPAAGRPLAAARHGRGALAAGLALGLVAGLGAAAVVLTAEPSALAPVSRWLERLPAEARRWRDALPLIPSAPATGPGSDHSPAPAVAATPERAASESGATRAGGQSGAPAEAASATVELPAMPPRSVPGTRVAAAPGPPAGAVVGTPPTPRPAPVSRPALPERQPPARAPGPGPNAPTVERVLIRPGATVSELAFERYGGYNALALDLIKEFNPDIDDLDRVMAGGVLTLPMLTLNTLLREQPDGSYRLILASLPSLGAATRLAQTVRGHGFEVVITARQVSRNSFLHRVEIDGLPSWEAAVQAWQTASRYRWFNGESPS